MKYTTIPVLVVVLCAFSSAAPPSDSSLTFRLLAMSDGIDSEATNAGFQSPGWNFAHWGRNAYEAADGQRLSVRYVELRTEEEAKRYFDWTLGKAEQITTQADKLDSSGTVVGRRAEVLLKPGQGKCAVIWTRGVMFRAVFAEDLRHAVALEKQYGRGRGSSGQVITIDAGEAKSLVRVVLRHEHIRLSSQYCELEQIDKPDKPFVRDYYSFSAACDYPNSAATTPFGIYVVSPRTGDVFEFNRCKWFRFAELNRSQRDIMRRTKRTEADEREYREATGCSPAG